MVACPGFMWAGVANLIVGANAVRANKRQIRLLADLNRHVRTNRMGSSARLRTSPE